MKIKEFAKNHKKEIIVGGSIVGGVALLIGLRKLYRGKVIHITDTSAIMDHLSDVECYTIVAEMKDGTTHFMEANEWDFIELGKMLSNKAVV